MALILPVVVSALLSATLRMGCGPALSGRDSRGGGSGLLVPVLPLGRASSVFLGATYVIGVVFDLVLPQDAMIGAWMPFMPGFFWLIPWSVRPELAESLFFGWFIALVFGDLRNAAVSRGVAA